MRLGSITWSILLWFPLFLTCQADLLSYANKLPTCAVNCIFKTIPASTCLTFTNSECICTNQDLLLATQTCARASCTPIELMTLMDTFNKACDIPPRSRQSQTLPCLVFEVFTIICILIRLWTRFKVADRFEVDDGVIILVFLSYLAFVTLGVYLTITSIGFDIWTLKPLEITNALKLFWVDELLYVIVLSLCRTSVLFLLMRVFVGQPFKWVCLGAMAIVWVSATIFTFLTAFQCRPVEYIWLGWKGDFGPHTCLSLNTVAYASAGSGLAQDIAILLIPLPMIYQLNMPWKRKAHVMIIFSLGIIAIVTSFLRLNSLMGFAQSENPTWEYTDAVIWTSAEVSASIICVCLPSMRIFLARSLPAIFGSSGAVESRQPGRDPHGPSQTLSFPTGRSTRKEKGSQSFGTETGSEVALNELSGSKSRDQDPQSSAECGNSPVSDKMPVRATSRTIQVDGEVEVRSQMADTSWFSFEPSEKTHSAQSSIRLDSRPVGTVTRIESSPVPEPHTGGRSSSRNNSRSNSLAKPPPRHNYQRFNPNSSM